MKLENMVNSIQSKRDLVEFVYALAEDLEANPEDWENGTLKEFLSAFAAWLNASDSYYRNQGFPVPIEPTWKNVGEMLMAAKIYE